jgi:hypothetical protein
MDIQRPKPRLIRKGFMYTVRMLCFCTLAAMTAIPVSTFCQAAPTISLTPRPNLGQAAPAPANLALNPPPPKGPTPMEQPVTGGFSVNTGSREEVRSFYNGIYPTSVNVPEGSTANVASCTPGHNSSAFQQAELQRINWVRAQAGMPASIYLDPIDDWGSQQMAVLMSENNVLDHDPTNTYACYNSFAALYAGGDQSLGANGAQAITDFIWDFGAKNNEVGHRRWILYPPEIVMGVGDVPASGTNAAANLTYVFDPASFGARPATRQPYVAWPPEGYVPYQVVFPYWSFALSNADLSAATVSMESNGVPVSTVIQPYQTGFGENTLVWVPMGLDATTEATVFPFSGADTVYSVTVSNITYNSNRVSYAYTVTVFDPAVPGADYVPTTLNGPAQAVAGTPTVYSAVAPNNPHVTSYNLLIAQLGSGNLFDNASGGLVNFTLTPQPNYSPTTTAPFGTNTCFNLEHFDTNSSPQLLQLNEVLLPTTNTILSFQSELGFATSDETARVQVSADNGANWTDLYAQAGNGGYESSFTPHTLSLSNYAGQTVLLRFNYDFEGGSFYNSGSPLGWYITGIALTNTQALLNQATNTSSFTNVASGDLADSANSGLANFTISPPPYYYVITNPPVGAEPHCFHLTHLDPASQLLQLNEVLLPSANSTVSFASQLGYATSDETARVQASTNNGATWNDLFVEAGSNGSGATNFTPYTLSLAAYVGQLTLLQFNFAFTGGGYYPQSDNYVGWNIEDIVLTNVQQQLVTVTNTTNFTFTPPQAGTYLLQAQPVIFSQFPLAFGPVKQVTVTSNLTPVILLGQPTLSNSQVLLNFTVSGPAATFNLLQATQLSPPAWTTNTAAVLTTNTPGSSYRFTAATNAPTRFYRIQSP